MRPATEKVLSGAAKKSVGEARVGRGAVGTIHHRKREGADGPVAD